MNLQAPLAMADSCHFADEMLNIHGRAVRRVPAKRVWAGRRPSMTERPDAPAPAPAFNQAVSLPKGITAIQESALFYRNAFGEGGRLTVYGGFISVKKIQYKNT